MLPGAGRCVRSTLTKALISRAIVQFPGLQKIFLKTGISPFPRHFGRWDFPGSKVLFSYAVPTFSLTILFKKPAISHISPNFLSLHFAKSRPPHVDPPAWLIVTLIKKSPFAPHLTAPQ
jgi:hypothetical protein